MTNRWMPLAAMLFLLNASTSRAAEPCEAFVNDYLDSRAGLSEGLEFEGEGFNRVTRIERLPDVASDFPYPATITFSNGKQIRFAIDSSSTRLTSMETLNEQTLWRLEFDGGSERCKIKSAWVIDTGNERPLLEVRGEDLGCHFFKSPPKTVLVRSCDAFIRLIFRLHDLQGLPRPVPGGAAKMAPAQ